MKKRDRERTSLRLVYDESEFASVRHQDRPDFVLRHHRATTEFGVEVTELYQTESDARARNHPLYISDLLGGGPHMHRDDVPILSVSTVEIRDSAGNLKAEGVPAILRLTPSRDQYSEAVAAVLRRKNEKTDGYLEGLSHVNLIIVDRFEAGRGLQGEYSMSDLFIPQLRSALLETRFCEIFLVTASADGHQVYRPLQMLLLMESFYLFLGALESFEFGASALELHDVVPLFIRTMKGAGMHLDLGSSADGSQCAVYRRVGIRHTGKGINVLDFHDHDPPTPVPLPSPPLRSEEIAAFNDHHASFVETNSFITELALDVVEDAAP